MHGAHVWMKKRFGRLLLTVIGVSAGMVPVWVPNRTFAADATPTPRVVSALGRLEPAGGVVHVASPYSIQGPSIVAELLVQEGQSVTNGQMLARTHTHAAALAAVTHAQKLLEAARARVAQAEAGAKPADIAVLDAEARLQQSELEDARRELERTRRLRTEGASSQQALDLAETRLTTQSNAVEAAQRRFVAGREVRPEDVAVTRAEVAVAEAQLERARAEWAQTIVRAPQAGRVLAVHASVGEEVGPGGLLDLGATEIMTVKAEVYEADIRRVHPGQKVEVTGDAFEGIATGTVDRVGLQVLANKLLGSDPSAFTDSRVVPVRIRLEGGTAVSDLSGALVNVRILP